MIAATYGEARRIWEPFLMMAEPHRPALIGAWLGPGARLLQRHELSIAASPERAYDALLEARFRDMPVVRLLFRLRRIPHTGEMTLRQFAATPPFLVLQEEPPREIVFGVAGRFFPAARPRAEELPATAEEFRAFAESGAMRAIANFRVDAAPGGARLSTETWVETFGDRARRLFALYWLIIGPFSALTRREFLRATRQAARE